MQRVHLTPPALKLYSHELDLTFSGTVTLLLPAATPAASYPSLLLLRARSFAVSLTATHNGTVLCADSPRLQAWARSLADAEMWAQLGYTTALSIFDDGAVKLELTRSSAAEAMMKEFAGGEVEGVRMGFEFTGEGPWGDATDRAVRAFWEDKVQDIAPVVGAAGLVEECGKRVLPLEVIAGVVVRMRGVGRKEAEEGLWRGMVKGLGARRKRLLRIKGAVEWEDGGEMLVSEGDGDVKKEEGDQLLFEDEESAPESLWGMLDEEESSDDGLLFEEREDSDDDFYLDMEREDYYAEDRLGDGDSNWEELMMI